MRRILISLLPAVALSLAAAPVMAEDYTPNGGTYPSGGGVTIPSSSYTPAPSALPGPFMLLGAPAAMITGGAVASSPRPNCGLIRDFNGRYTAVCGP